MIVYLRLKLSEKGAVTNLAEIRKIGKHRSCVFRHFGLFSWKMCLNNRFKSTRNYSDQFGSNKISVLFCEGPKPNMSMIYVLLSPGEPLFMI